MMAKKPKSPVLPRNVEDPTGVDRLERGAINKLEEKLKQIGREYPKLLERIPSQPVVNKRYTYQLDKLLLDSILEQADQLIESILLEGGSDDLWLYELYVKVAYERGTAQEFANLSNQSPAYKAGQESVTAIKRSEPYLRRIALVQARVFEEMKGFTASIQADMTRILTDGMGRGLNPDEIAKSLSAQTGLEQGRANRIARTEITTALRRARWDESEDAQERYGLKTMLMHISALSPTTRVKHALRHAHLYTIEAVREWYAKDANSINCKCNQVSVLVDKDGNPLVPSIVDRAQKMLQKSQFTTNQKCSCCH
ncbi:phage minor head protein [Vibrio casei]|uniref:Phage head morphogenesis protein n=1 Tax=Vibrio casei TaxID=673372 RepID=A0A368LHR3_9VIBR|nr:phage minor head protein [Vibrio casei]RCS70166.1 phage head morphogenesis protein [Vibrio casei]